MRHLATLSLFLATVGAFSSATTHAQVAQAELRGTVTDESGAVLPGVSVTATHVETGVIRAGLTSDRGSYVMPALPVGNYTVRAELAGFTIVSKEGITLSVGGSAVLNFALKVAALEETVTVTGETPLSSTRSARHSAGMSR